MTNARSPIAFTLIELLVAVTIIVVLLALLTPALDKAIYQAELAVCAANQKGVATGSQLYAMGSRRWYPDRPGVRNAISGLGNWWSAEELKADLDTIDDRITIKDHITPKQLVDPLCQSVDLSVGSNDADSFVFSSFSLRFGYQFSSDDLLGTGDAQGKRVGQAGMFRIGDRLKYGKDAFNVLVSDHDRVAVQDGNVFSGHPDADGLMVSGVYQNRYGLAWKFTMARWEHYGSAKRGPIDMNYAFDDGSVGRYQAVRWDDWRLDGRLTNVPWYNTGVNAATEWSQMPVTR